MGSFHFHHVGLRPVFLDQPGDLVTAFARAFGAFDAEHVELAFDVTKNEISAGHYAGRSVSLFDHLVGGG